MKEIPTKCARCKKIPNLELYVCQVRTSERVDPPKGKPYGRFRISIDCPFCGLKQAKIVKFEGDSSVSKIHSIVRETWQQLQTKIKPRPDSRGRWGTMSWVKDIQDL